MTAAKTRPALPGWDRLTHGGLLLDPARLHALAQFAPGLLPRATETQLRKRAGALVDGNADIGGFVAFVLEEVCGFRSPRGDWKRGSRVPPAEGRRALSGATVKPRQLWIGRRGARLPVFLNDGCRLGIGRGRRVTSGVLGWLRAGGEPLALLTNGREWRLLFAGLDHEAWCQWDLDLWFEEGKLSDQVTALRALLHPDLWIPETDGGAPPLLQAIRDTRKGQAELSETLGERVREAVEVLIRGHGEPLRDRCADVAPADIYRAACRVAMRLVVILFAEARGLLPRNNALYDASYGLNGLFERLDRTALRGGFADDDAAAWPRVLALFALVRDGSHHPDLPVTAYGGELFAPGGLDDEDGVARALSVFETACFEREALPDRDVHEMLRLLTRTTVRIRQARAGTRVTVPVDFSDLSSEYIGVLYEGLLDYELKAAPEGDPVVFLSVGDQAALPLSRLEAMDARALKALFESLKKTDGATAADDAAEGATKDDEAGTEGVASSGDAEAPSEDQRRRSRERAEAWARRAAQAAGLVRKFRGRDTPERRLAHDRQIEERARKLVARVVLPGEWYLVRWGGTRKGSGSFYTRPGLAVPTVHRTLRPLAYNPPPAADGEPDRDAPPVRWTPKPPERILAVTVCDPACGSGTFPLAALRFLTDALYASLQHHGRLQAGDERTLVRLLGIRPDGDGEPEGLGDELIPCRPEDDAFEPRLRAVLRRYVVERCIYAVDLDPLAVELCRLSLWIETMDRNLPFGFLDHKIKCGNALIGVWFDQFRHYPVMAWKNREGGDKSHGNGVHFEKTARTKAIKAFVKDTLTPDLWSFLMGPSVFAGEGVWAETAAAHDEAFAVLSKCHALPVRDTAERARVYRRKFLGSPAWRSLKQAMDRWCACWFWPMEEIKVAPAADELCRPAGRDASGGAAHRGGDAFLPLGAGIPRCVPRNGFRFRRDPRQSTVGHRQTELEGVLLQFGPALPLLRQAGGSPEADRLLRERRGGAYLARLLRPVPRPVELRPATPQARSATPTRTKRVRNRFAVGAGNLALHQRWRDAREQLVGYTDVEHPFRHQGSADLNLYKLFLETAHALLRFGGRAGIPDSVGAVLRPWHGSAAGICSWSAPGGSGCSASRIARASSRSIEATSSTRSSSRRAETTEAIRTAFMRRNLDDWERAEEIATPYTRAQITEFSPKSRAIPEIQFATRPRNPGEDLRERRPARRRGTYRVGDSLHARVGHGKRLTPLPPAPPIGRPKATSPTNMAAGSSEAGVPSANCGRNLAWTRHDANQLGTHWKTGCSKRMQGRDSAETELRMIRRPRAETR